MESRRARSEKMDANQIVWNLKRLIRDGFPYGLALSALEREYIKYFDIPHLPTPDSIQPGCSDWAQVFSTSPKFQEWFKLDSKKRIKVLPKPERDLKVYLQIVNEANHILARVGAKVRGSPELSESESDEEYKEDSVERVIKSVDGKIFKIILVENPPVPEVNETIHETEVPPPPPSRPSHFSTSHHAAIYEESTQHSEPSPKRSRIGDGDDVNIAAKSPHKRPKCHTYHKKSKKKIRDVSSRTTTRRSPSKAKPVHEQPESSSSTVPQAEGSPEQTRLREVPNPKIQASPNVVRIPLSESDCYWEPPPPIGSPSLPHFLTNADSDAKSIDGEILSENECYEFNRPLQPPASPSPSPPPSSSPKRSWSRSFECRTVEVQPEEPKEVEVQLNQLFRPSICKLCVAKIQNLQSRLAHYKGGRHQGHMIDWLLKKELPISDLEKFKWGIIKRRTNKFESWESRWLVVLNKAVRVFNSDPVVERDSSEAETKFRARLPEVRENLQDAYYTFSELLTDVQELHRNLKKMELHKGMPGYDDIRRLEDMFTREVAKHLQEHKGKLGR